MTDKKSCKNCFHKKDTCAFDSSGETGCKSWQRNPRLRLSILPEEIGYYWYGKPGEKPDMLYVSQSMLNKWNDGDDELAKGFSYQGPIRPEGE
jgi:hypothetical protein